MISYCEIYQERADKFAKKFGCSGAQYIGPASWHVYFENGECEDMLLFDPVKTQKSKIGKYHHILVGVSKSILIATLPNRFYIESLEKKDLHNNRRTIVLSEYNIKSVEVYKISVNKRVVNSNFLQSKADLYARENGYYAAGFLGSYYGYAVYSLFCADNIPRPTGAPYFLLVNKKGQMRYVCNFDEGYMGSFHIIDNMIPYLSYTKGKNIYNALIKRIETGDYDEQEKEYLEYLKSLDVNHWKKDSEFSLSRREIFNWIEAAFRVGEQIIIVDDPKQYGEKFIAFKRPYLEMRKISEI